MVWVAAALVLLLGLVIAPRLILGLFVLAALIVGGTLGYFYIEAKIAENQRSKIIMEASASDQCKDPMFPIFISITNHSRKAVEEINFSLVAKRQGYSSVIYDGYNTSDKIMEAGRTYSTCWSLYHYNFRNDAYKNGPYNDLAWEANVNSVRFAK